LRIGEEIGFVISRTSMMRTDMGDGFQKMARIVYAVIASAAKQSSLPRKERSWIASLRSQ
jgi:hypothetical protein